MLHKSDKAKLVKMLVYLKDIDFILKRHGDESAVLQDVEGKHAVLMCLLQVGELVNKLNDINLAEELSAKQIYALRNKLAHDYEAILISKILHILQYDLPVLKNKIISKLENESDYGQLKMFWES